MARWGLALERERPGRRPATTAINPHVQLEQHSPTELQERLLARIASLPGVTVAPSLISLPGARAFLLGEAQGAGPATGTSRPLDGFLLRTEFAHLHPPEDGSLHAALPPWIVGRVTRNGWAELHPVAALYGLPPNIVMIYGPRDADDLDVVSGLAEISWAYASGRLEAPRGAWVVDRAHSAP